MLLFQLQGKSSVDVIVCLKASETGVLSKVLLAHGFMLYSSSHSGSLASTALWLSSMSMRCRCLATTHYMCCDGAQSPEACTYWDIVIKLGHTHTQSICYFLVQWCAIGICACASCFSVTVYLILVFLSSLVSNLKPPNGIFQSPFPNCNDTLMR